MDQVRCGFSRLSVTSAILKARYIIEHMEHNASFPNPPFLIEELRELVNRLEELQGEISASNYMRVGLRNECFEKLKHMMAALSSYVNITSNGNPSMLTSSGFEMRKHRAKATIPDVINGIHCSNMTKNGCVLVRWKGDRSRQYYIVETTQTPSVHGSWTKAGIVTKCKLEVTGLTSGQRVNVRVCAVNLAGQSMWSNVAELMVA